MTVVVRVRRPIPDARWRRRVSRENRPEGGREGGREGMKLREGVTCTLLILVKKHAAIERIILPCHSPCLLPDSAVLNIPQNSPIPNLTAPGTEKEHTCTISCTYIHGYTMCEWVKL